MAFPVIRGTARAAWTYPVTAAAGAAATATLSARSGIRRVRPLTPRLCKVAMRFWIGLALIGFPALDLLSLYPLAHRLGWWLMPWLAMSAFTGIVLVREARYSVLQRTTAARHDPSASLGALMDSRRLVLAGLLFIFPGIISDLAALVILASAPVYPTVLAPASARVASGPRGIAARR